MNVDRLWRVWQDRNPTLASTYSTTASVTNIMNFRGLAPSATVSKVFNTRNNFMNDQSFCFRYSNSVVANTPQLHGRDLMIVQGSKSAYKHRIPAMVSDDLMRRMSYDVEKIKLCKKNHQKIVRFTEFYNALDVILPRGSGAYQEECQIKGWRSRTDEEAKENRDLFDSLIADFDAQTQSEKAKSKDGRTEIANRSRSKR
jgi:hypothetical protein